LLLYNLLQVLKAPHSKLGHNWFEGVTSRIFSRVVRILRR
jgi:hypothetical protein